MTNFRSLTTSLSSIAETVSKDWIPPSSALVHWDGKLMASLDGSGDEERLPILLSGVDGTKLLGAPPLPPKDENTPMGTIITDAVVQLLEEWGVADNVVGMVFDTTSVNTGELMREKLVIRTVWSTYLNSSRFKVDYHFRHL